MLTIPFRRLSLALLLLPYTASSRDGFAGKTTEEPVLVIETVEGPGAAGKSAAGTCFTVDTIRIEGGLDLFGRKALKTVALPFASSCQSNESVGGLLEALNGYFADKGFATTRAWLPEQDIAASRTLVVRVVPGRIDDVLYKEERQPYRGLFLRMAGLSRDVVAATSFTEAVRRADGWLEGLDDHIERVTLLPPSARIALARTISKGDALHVDRLQDTLDSLNRVPSHAAKAELVPGGDSATSDVRITNRINHAFRLYAGYDTESIEGVDRLRFGITAEKDSLVSIEGGELQNGLGAVSGVDGAGFGAYTGVAPGGGTLDTVNFVLDDVAVPPLDLGAFNERNLHSVDASDFGNLERFTGLAEAARLLGSARIDGSLSLEEPREQLYRNAAEFVERTGAIRRRPQRGAARRARQADGLARDSHRRRQARSRSASLPSRRGYAAARRARRAAPR